MQKEIKFSNDENDEMLLSYFNDTETYYIEIKSSPEDQEPRVFPFSHQELADFIDELKDLLNKNKPE